MGIEAIDFVEKLESFWKKAKGWGVFDSILKIPDMFCHPRRFWQEYQAMTIQGKWTQFATYGALFLLTIWLVSYDNLTVNDLARIFALEVAALFAILVIVTLANMIVKGEWKDFWFFAVILCYTKFICDIPALIALRAYYDTESPIVLGLAAFFSVIIELIFLVYPAYVWQTTKRKIVLAILLSVAFLNVYDGVFILTGWPRPKSSNFENNILKERFILGKSLNNTYDIPTYVITRETSNEIWYLYNTPIDTVASLKFDDKVYINNLISDIDSLKAISARCRFKTNKDFFDQVYILKKGILYVHETKMYKDSPIVRQTDVMQDSVIVDRINYRRFDKDLEEMNRELLMQEINQQRQFKAAFSTNSLGALWHPVYFIWWFLENKD